MIFFIMFIVVVLNALCIYLMYRFLKDVDKKEKFIFIAVGVAVMYGITAFVHWISIQGLDGMYKEGVAKDIVTFLFVPIDGLIILPALASSYNSYKQNKLSLNMLGKRMSVLLIPFAIVLVLECIFIKNVQVAVTNAYDDSTKFQYEEYIEDTNTMGENYMTTGNIISNETLNEVANEETNEVSTNSIDDSINVNETENNNVNENKVSNTTKANNVVDD